MPQAGNFLSEVKISAMQYGEKSQMKSADMPIIYSK
jgi:hypothetical protein